MDRTDTIFSRMVEEKKTAHEIAVQSEMLYIIDVLKMVNWRRNEAAKILGIDRSTLYRKMKKYGIKRV